MLTESVFSRFVKSPSIWVSKRSKVWPTGFDWAVLGSFFELCYYKDRNWQKSINFRVSLILMASGNKILLFKWVFSSW
jgi:hypothetical protein